MIVAVEDCLIGIGREVAVRIRGKGSGDMAFCVDLERSGLAFLIGAQAGEFGDIKGMDRASLDIGNGLVDRFLGAGSAAGAQLRQRNSVLIKAFGPVDVEFLAVEHCADGVLVIDIPFVGGGDKRCIGAAESISTL